MTPTLGPTQYSALKTFAMADATAAGFIAAANDQALADWFNTPDGTFTVWRPSVQTAEVGKAVNYVAVEAMTDANRGRINTFYLMNPLSFDPSRSDIRAYWANTFSGSLGGQGQATRDALDALYRKLATRAEKTLANTTGGNGANATPAALVFEGQMSAAEASLVRVA